MNSVNIVYLFGVLCILVSPSFSAPQSGAPPAVNRKEADDSQNEVTSEFKKDAETFQPVNSPSGQPSVGPVSPGSAASPVSPASPDTPITPEFMGGSTGIITKIGVEGPFICHNITCPAETIVCKFNSTFNPDAKTQNIQIRCLDKSDKVLLAETKTEPIDTKPFIDFDLDHFFTSVTDRMNGFFNDMVNSFRW